MSFLKTIPVSAAQGEVLALYQRQQGPYGFVPNYAKVWCYRPELMQDWATLQRNIKKNIDYKIYELATFAAAQAMGNSGCSLAHAKVLLEHFYTTKDIIDIVENDGKNTLSLKEQAIVRFARQVVGNAATISEQDLEQLRSAGCSEAEIFDVVVTASARCFFAKIHDALGVKLDSTASAMDKSLLDLLVVGRPISTEPVESL
jgi:uncharacterized peroxidase-related enzyme